MLTHIPYHRLDVQEAICIHCHQCRPSCDLFYIASDLAICKTCHVIGRHCSRCRKFYLYTSNDIRRQGYCRTCNRIDRHEKYQQKGKSLDTRRNERDYVLRRNFNISRDEYDEMYAHQMGLCAICGQAETFTGPKCHGNTPVLLAVDHCHATGLVRELLCNRCNMLLGMCQDNIEVLHRAADYLLKHSM